MMKKIVHGDLIVSLSLVFLLIMSLVGAALESVSIQTAKSERRADASRAMESAFAEYQKELFEEYQVFSIEGSYETDSFSVENILNRLSYYGGENMELTIERIRYLSDQNGQPFYEQAVEYMKEKTGAEKLEEFLGYEDALEIYNDNLDVYEKENVKMSETLNQMLQDSEQKLPESDNPIQIISKIKNESLLKVVLPEKFSLSEKSLEYGNLPSERDLNQGIGTWEGKRENMQDIIFFNLYLCEKFGNATNEKDNHVISYEMEYLLSGKKSDKENLEKVIGELCNLRFAADYMYLLSDSEKQAEARTLALTLCTLLTVPGITEVVTQGIMLAWAYGEAVQDVKALLRGEKIGLWKSAAT